LPSSLAGFGHGKFLAVGAPDRELKNLRTKDAEILRKDKSWACP